MKLLLTSLGVVLLAATPAAAQTDLGPLNLPGSFAPLPFGEDFETAAGVVPGYMALTAINSTTLVADPEAWCNIGNLGACMNPYGGSFALEMGLIPGSTNYHNVRNAMVIGLDGTGYGGSTLMTCQAYEDGEETNAVDGIWVSADGIGWYRCTTATTWGTIVGPIGAWERLTGIDLASTPVSTAGPFYLAFVQEDNFPYNDLDGVGIDEIDIPQDLYYPSYAASTLTAGYYATLTVTEAPPDGTAFYLMSFTGTGSATFMGVTTGLAAPIRNFVTLPLDPGGTAIYAAIVPAGLTGTTIYHQVVTADSIMAAAWTSNVITSTIL
ncbi:MAG: hypothetical protein EYC70_09645 [Planctomycetota bacterium]|nr:MAG: hypothetical protein EYC70_09645 [Planctomycetota bacterium]